MKKFTGKGLSKASSFNERDFAYIKFLEANREEILQVFQIQLDKKGDVRREKAAKQILEYSLDILCDKHKSAASPSLNWDGLIARGLEFLVNILEAVNENDDKKLEKALEELPWGESGTGDVMSENACMFALWLMSDEDRESHTGVFKKVFESHRGNYPALYGSFDEFLKFTLEFEGLDRLIAINKEARAKLNNEEVGNSN